MSADKNTATTRPVTTADLDTIVALDRKVTGQSRRGFYEKRLAAQGRDPRAFASLAIQAEGRLAGFVFAQILDGEFGGKEPIAVLDALCVDPDARGGHLGRQLMAALERQLAGHGVRELQTQADWTAHELIRFFGASGFELAPRLVLERETTMSF
jgi:GNAT superfamily N-acetyltransferase